MMQYCLTVNYLRRVRNVIFSRLMPVDIVKTDTITVKFESFEDFLLFILYFIYVFIYLTRMKASEVLYNYPDLLPEMPNTTIWLKFFILFF